MSSILPESENADSEEIVETGTLSTSRAKIDKIENSDWLSFHHFKISSDTCDDITNLDPIYLSMSSVWEPTRVKCPPIASATCHTSSS